MPCTVVFISTGSSVTSISFARDINAFILVSAGTCALTMSL